MKERILRHKNLLPILLLCCFAIWTIIEVQFIMTEYEGEFYEQHYRIENYLAFIFLIADLIIYFKFRPYFKYAVLTTVVLGLLGILNYHTFISTLNIVVIPLQITSLIIAIIYIALNYERTKNKLFGEYVPEAEQLPDLEKVETFKRKFTNKSTEELTELIGDKRFVKEAKIASTEILNERNAQKPSW